MEDRVEANRIIGCIGMEEDSLRREIMSAFEIIRADERRKCELPEHWMPDAMGLEEICEYLKSHDYPARVYKSVVKTENKTGNVRVIKTLEEAMNFIKQEKENNE